MDITQLMLDDHGEQRRLFAILEQIDDADQSPCHRGPGATPRSRRAVRRLRSAQLRACATNRSRSDELRTRRRTLAGPRVVGRGMTMSPSDEAYPRFLAYAARLRL